MPIDFPSKEWTQAFCGAVNGNPAYRAAAKEWTHGKVAYVIKADARIGVTKDMAMVLDLHQGECRQASYVEASAAESADFVIVSEYEKWREVMSGAVDPTKAMMQNKLRLQKGHLGTLIKNVTSNKELVKSALSIDTRYP